MSKAKQVYVKVASLASLHPGWNDVLRLDALRNQARSLPAIPPFTTSPPTTIGEPPPLPPVTGELTGLQSRERERIRQVSGPAMRRIDNLRSTLNLRNERQLAERERTIRAEVAADIANHTEAVRKQEGAEKQAITRRYHVPIRDSWLKQYAYETQVQALPPGQAIIDARAELANAKQTREGLEAKSKSEQDAVSAKADAEIAAYERQRHALATAQMEEYKNSLAAETAREVAESQHTVNLVLSRLEPLEPPVVRAVHPAPVAQLESPAEVSAAARSGPQPHIQAASQRAQEALAEQRNRLLSTIEGDIKRRIDAVAARRNWKVTYSPAPGVPDITGQVADILRGSWEP